LIQLLEEMVAGDAIVIFHVDVTSGTSVSTDAGAEMESTAS
jgi:hypothetical protein